MKPSDVDKASELLRRRSHLSNRLVEVDRTETVIMVLYVETPAGGSRYQVSVTDELAPATIFAILNVIRKEFSDQRIVIDRELRALGVDPEEGK